MLRTPNHLPPHLRPINTRIQLLIHQPTNHHIIPPHQIQAMRLLSRRLLVLLRSNDALDGVFEHEVRHLVAADERAGEGAAVDGYDEDFFCGGGGCGVSLLPFCVWGCSVSLVLACCVGLRNLLFR